MFVSTSTICMKVQHNRTKAPKHELKSSPNKNYILSYAKGLISHWWIVVNTMKRKREGCKQKEWAESKSLRQKRTNSSLLRHFRSEETQAINLKQRLTSKEGEVVRSNLFCEFMVWRWRVGIYSSIIMIRLEIRRRVHAADGSHQSRQPLSADHRQIISEEARC